MKIKITETTTHKTERIIEITPTQKKKSPAPQKPAVQSNSPKNTVIINPK